MRVLDVRQAPNLFRLCLLIDPFGQVAPEVHRPSLVRLVISPQILVVVRKDEFQRRLTWRTASCGKVVTEMLKARHYRSQYRLAILENPLDENFWQAPPNQPNPKASERARPHVEWHAFPNHCEFVPNAAAEALV